MNKAKYYGKKFGEVCMYLGTLLMMIMTVCLPNDMATSLVFVFNWWAMLGLGIGFALYCYGAWRCDYG